MTPFHVMLGIRRIRVRTWCPDATYVRTRWLVFRWGKLRLGDDEVRRLSGAPVKPSAFVYYDH